MSESSKKQNGKKSFTRHVLMVGGVFIVLTGCAWFYLSSGRFIATDNAYVKAAKILITPEVAGTITSVSVTDNQNVHAGDVLFVIDPASYQIAFDEAEADAANTYTQIEQLKAQYRQKEEDLAKAQVEVTFTEEEYNRRIELAKRGAVAQTELNETKRQRDAAIKAISSIQEEINGILAALTGDADIRPEDHPLYKKALAKQQNAELNLERTTVKAPVNGMIGIAPRKGDYARASVPLLNLVGNDDVWIEANYKETELTDVKIGQSVAIEVDTYPGHEWQGHVESISPATGSEFSVLPAQNATGNWVKVVQRIAVHIAVDPGPQDLPLRTGMSTHVSIDIGHYPHSLIQNAFAKGR